MMLNQMMLVPLQLFSNEASTEMVSAVDKVSNEPLWQVAIKGAQQKLNDKDLEKEKEWQESFEEKLKFTHFWNKLEFVGLPIFHYKHMTSEETKEVKPA